MYTTKTQAVQNVSKLLKAHGYDPAAYDVLTIAEEYRQEAGGYESIFANPSIVFAYVDDNKPASVPPAGFTARDWDAPEHDETAPRDRYEVYDGPEHGGTTTHWEPDWGVGVNIDGYCDVGQGITMRIDVARRLRDDLTAVLNKIDH